MTVTELTDATAPDFLEAHDLVLLAFLDERDAGCRSLRARLHVLAAKHDRAAFGALDVGRWPLVADALGVTGVPFLVVFHRGGVVDRLMGAPPDAVVDDVLRARLREDRG